jgi:hypothetical protein
MFKLPHLPVGLVVALSITFFSVNVSAEMAQVILKDGATLEGELLGQNNEQVQLRIAGIDTTIDRDNIESMSLMESDEQYFKKQREKLDDDDLDGRLKLTREMLDREAFAIAKREAEALDDRFTDNPAVVDMLQLIKARENLKATSDATQGLDLREYRENPPGTPNVLDPAGQGRTPSEVYLSPEQIALIKVYEVDLESNPRVTIPRATLDEFLEKYADRDDVPRDRSDRVAFLRASGTDQLDLFFKVQARDLYSQVNVRTDPAPIAEFRRLVNPRYVARYFEPTFARGQVDGLRLINQRPEGPEEAYTNFYLLTQFEYNGLPLIDRSRPEESLLVQWGLPREEARHPAPDVEGWRPAFRNNRDTQYQQYVEWIDSLLFNDHPDYDIDYTAPDTAEE